MDIGNQSAPSSSTQSSGTNGEKVSPEKTTLTWQSMVTSMRTQNKPSTCEQLGAWDRYVYCYTKSWKNRRLSLITHRPSRIISFSLSQWSCLFSFILFFILLLLSLFQVTSTTPFMRNLQYSINSASAFHPWICVVVLTFYTRLAHCPT